MIMEMIIKCEEDIEWSIKELVKLAKLPGKKKVLLTFPSEIVYSVFIKDLQEEFLHTEDVPSNVNIDADVIVL